MGQSTTRTNPEDHVTFALAKWATSVTYDALSPEAVERAKLVLFDALGCALGGSQQPEVEIALAHCKEMGGKPTCTVLGSGLRTDPATASFLNALSIRATGWNDVYWKADPCHPSDVVPAALSPCEMLGLGGKDLILGTAIAYEIEMRLAEIAQPGLVEHGWHHAGLTAICAPIVAGRMLGLDAPRIQHAVGISACPSLCLGAVNTGRLTMSTRAVDPRATRTGVEAALLAKRGFTGPAHVLDGANGLAQVLGRSGLTFRMEALTDGLPTAPEHRWKLLDGGMRPFAVATLAQSPLTALLMLVRERKIAAAEVAEVRVEVVTRAAELLADPAEPPPTTRDAAARSLAYAIAVGLVDGMVGPRQFRDERVKDPALLPMMDKVKVIASPELDARFPAEQPSRVTIVLRSGAEHVQQVDVPKGDPRAPMTREELRAKFGTLGHDLIGTDSCDAAGDMIMGLEHESSLESLLALLVA